MGMRLVNTVWYTLCFLLLMVGEAVAFGPVTHVSFSVELLAGLALVAPPLARLLRSQVFEYLYGSVAADIIVGKNLARPEVHCHNWQTGFKVLEGARSDAQQAFAWGYLSHLAADTVAHNYYVPTRMVSSYTARGAGHAYWELRLDEKCDSADWLLVERLSRQTFVDEHELLGRTVEPTLLDFPTNVRIFNGLLLLSRLKRWRRLLGRMAARSRLSLTDREAQEVRKLAVDAVFSILIDREESSVASLDPTGRINLRVAAGKRRRLRERGTDAAAAAEVVRSASDSFLSSITSKGTWSSGCFAGGVL